MKGASKALEVFHPATSRLKVDKTDSVWCPQCKMWFGPESAHYRIGWTGQ